MMAKWFVIIQTTFFISVLVLLVTGATLALAQSPPPRAPAAPVAAANPPVPAAPKIDEIEALRIGKLLAERQAAAAAYARMVTQQELLKMQMGTIEREFQAKDAALSAAVRDAATKAKLKPEEGWVPDLENGVWKKKDKE